MAVMLPGPADCIPTAACFPDISAKIFPLAGARGGGGARSQRNSVRSRVPRMTGPGSPVVRALLAVPSYGADAINRGQPEQPW